MNTFLYQEKRSIPSAISVRQNDILSQLEKLRMVSTFNSDKMLFQVTHLFAKLLFVRKHHAC